MKMDIKRRWPVAALSLIGMASTLSAAKYDKNENMRDDACAPAPAVACYPDDCKSCYCLGPENYGVNAPVRPRTCNGDWVVTVAGFYWNAHQDGMEFAIHNNVVNPDENPFGEDIISAGLNTLVEAEFKNPDFNWDFGFKAGIGYNTTCDGWDIGVVWTWYRGKAGSSDEAEFNDNAVLLPIWSAFAPKQGLTLYATDIDTSWRLDLNVIDIELGREFWTSKYLTMRPFIGLRIAYIDQRFDIWHSGGSWDASVATLPEQTAQNNQVTIDNDYRGVGPRAGLNTVWNLGCGWGIYGDFAFSILYGRFDVDHDETNRAALAPNDKTKIADTEDSFRASRPGIDLGLGIQYQTMFCDCQYGFTAMLGWENHVFFDQNQMWRIARIGDIFNGPPVGSPLNNTGENVYGQSRGDLDTQGWTLTVRFEF